MITNTTFKCLDYSIDFQQQPDGSVIGCYSQGVQSPEIYPLKETSYEMVLKQIANGERPCIEAGRIVWIKAGPIDPSEPPSIMESSILAKTDQVASLLIFQDDHEKFSIEGLEEIHLTLVKKNDVGELSLKEILDFQDQLNHAQSSFLKDNRYQKIVEGTEVLVIDVLAIDKFIQTDSNDMNPFVTFDYEGARYIVRPTRGQGSCAIHALLGEEIGGIYRFPGDDLSSSAHAKSHFTDAIPKALIEDPFIKETFLEVIKGYLSQLSQKDHSADMLYQSEQGRILKQQWLAINERYDPEIKKLEYEEALLWFSMIELKGNKEDETSLILDQLVSDMSTLTVSASPDQESRETVLQSIKANPTYITNKVNGNTEAYLRLIEANPNKEKILKLRENQNQLRTKREEERDSFILSAEMVSHYIFVVNNPLFYLNTNEIKLAAQLFNKSVIIVAYKEKRIEPTEIINQDAASEPIFIHHRGVHFSRCVKANTNRKVASVVSDYLFRGLHEDAYPERMFVASHCKVVNVDPITQEIEFRMTEEDSQRLHLRLSEYFADDPAMLLKMTDQYQIPKANAAHLRSHALAQLIESVEEEIQKVTTQQDKSWASNKEIDTEKIPKLKEVEESLKKRVEKSKEEEREFQKKWVRTVKQYYEKSCRLFIYNVDKNEIKEFYDLFYALRELNPSSLIPFYPILTVLSSEFEEESLKAHLLEAKLCDAYHTYALTVQFMRLAVTYNQTLFFRRYKADSVLKVLREVYPDDLMIPLLIESIPSESQVSPKFQKIALSLEKALNDLASNDSRSAIKQLVMTSSALMGYSLLQRYLALAYSLAKGFNTQKIMKRLSFLPDIHENKVPSSLLQNIEKMLSTMTQVGNTQKTETTKSEFEPLLNAFIEMAEKYPLDINFAKVFIEVSADVLKSNMDHLPFVFFGIQNLASRLVIKPNEFDTIYRPLHNALYELMTIVVSVCFDIDDLDPWISEHYEKKVEKDAFFFVVSFPGINFGNHSSPEKKRPTFKFLDNLRLTKESINSLATSVTKQVYSMILGLMTSHLMPDYLVQYPIVLLPHDQTIFTEFLQHGLMIEKETNYTRTEKFDSAVGYLKEYLDIREADRPYLVNKAILDWSKFCVFARTSTTFLSNQMEKEILDTYYPRDLSEEKFRNDLEEVNKRKNFLTDKKDKSVVALAYRDVFLANHHLEMKSANMTVHIKKDDSIYELFSASRQLFGWRYGESFTEWGNRLKNAEEFGAAAADFNMMEHVNLNLSLSKPPVVSGNFDKKGREVLRLFLQFWIEFHEKTKEKNDFIGSGGDEEDPKNERHENKWDQGLDNKNWTSIIQKNKPETYPNFKNLAKDKQDDLRKIVGNKYEHDVQIKDLKKHCIKPGYIQNSDEFINILTTTLIANVEYDRKEAYHSIFVENEAQACRIYKILLEISLERMVRSSLIMGGADCWMETDTTKIKEMLLPKLNHLIGAFHGPETHPSGNGPLQIHYNAKIVTTNLSLVNVHIYYE